MIDYGEFVKQYMHLKKTKLLFIIAGGGSEFSKLLAVPGVSTILRGIFCCYDEETRMHIASDPDSYYGKEPESIVSQDWVKWMYNRFDDSLDYLATDIVIISAAYPTLRERKGDNRAWIMMSNYVSPREIRFSKETSADRSSIDSLIQLRISYEQLVVEQVFRDLLV